MPPARRTGLAAAASLALLTGFGSADRSPLDLPRAEAACAPEFAFFGTVREGDAPSFWLLDKSASMAWGDAFEIVQAEVSASLGSLSPSLRFSLVAFSSDSIQFSPDLVPATPENVSAAQFWVQSLVPDGSTCMAPAGALAIQILNATPGGDAMLVIADGEPNCPGPAETLATITAANYQGHPIHVANVGGDAGGVAFLQQLAVMNGGDYISVAGAPVPPEILRGDADGNGSVGIGDAIRILQYSFGTGCPTLCRDAADATDDGIFEPISDAITLLGALFVAGHPPLAEPSTECGVDPTADSLLCGYVSCP